MGGLRGAVLVPPIGPICAFRNALFVDTVSSEGILVSAWSRTQGTPPRTLLHVPIATRLSWRICADMGGSNIGERC